MEVSSTQNTFTLTWKIQNFSMCDNEECLSSPDILVDLLDKTEWYLELFRRDEHNLLCCLNRRESLQSSGNIKIGCSMTLVSVDNLLNLTKTRKCGVFEECDYVEFVLGNVDDIFANRDVLMPSDTLTIRCCMWKTDGVVEYPRVPTIKDPKTIGPKEKLISDQTAVLKSNLIKHMYAGNADTLDRVLSEKMYLSSKKDLENMKTLLFPNAYNIHSQIPFEARRKVWEVKHFDEIQIDDTIFTSVPAVARAPPFVLALYLSKDFNDNEEVCLNFQMNFDGKTRYVVKCIITILNDLYEDQHRIQDFYIFNYGKDVWHIPLVQKSKLCKDQYFNKGSLLLCCEFFISEGSSLVVNKVTASFHSVEDRTS